jgi:hypothetical protein
MLFSYFFDTKKTHRLEFHFQMLDYAIRDNTTIEVLFNGKVTEIIDDMVVRSESKLGTFRFDPANNEHDIDFHRIRIAEQDKWIFHIKNNKDASQDVIVGLISKTANKNPIGLDIYHTSDLYTAELKGNNLAIVEQEYQPPVLTQTLIYTTFNTPEYPKGFTSNTAIYRSDKQMYELKDFRQELNPSIDKNTAFSVEMNIAPVNTNVQGDIIFAFKIDGVGQVQLLKNYLQFIKEGEDYTTAVKVPLDAPATPEYFYNFNSFLETSKMIVSGDGVGRVTISYAGRQFTANYNANQEIKFIELVTQNQSTIVKTSAIVRDEDVAKLGTAISSSTRPGIAGEWDAANVLDDNDLTAWASAETGSIQDNVWIGMDLHIPRSIGKIVFKQHDAYGVSKVKVETSTDGNVWDFVEEFDTLGQALVELNLTVNASARYWRLLAGSNIERLPIDGTTIDEPWKVCQVQMYERVPEAPADPTNLEYTINPDNSVVLTWEHPGGTGIMYRIYNDGSYMGIETNDKTCVLSNLAENKEYNIQVVAVANQSYSGLSNRVTFTLNPLPIDWSTRVPVYVDNFIVKFFK